MNKLMKIFLILFVSMIISQKVSANSPADVSIQVNSTKEVYSRQFEADLIVKFKENKLYNDKVYLSYHVYDKEGNEILWEGKRYPLALNAKGNYEVNINIDLLSDLSNDLKDIKMAHIKFDLVDEKNVYWFSTNNNLVITSEQIVYEDNFLKEFSNTLISSISASPIIFIINAIVLIIFIVGYLKIKKEALFIS